MLEILLAMLFWLTAIPVALLLVYWVAKAARYGWLRGEELFFGQKLKRTFKREDFPDDET